ncbi:hypothetical protein JCM10512_3412 [Bacteroides reticulotermitis JCM 10512]|uniref:Outer membrane protein n=2 Tax=Bacteroides reticulotermitis TaxID=1133319 RepID=W4UW25_9BACE|nr:hypothetical protein JCM10512_3412 [Bacteroides reticulotermitis JCM 10512]
MGFCGLLACSDSFLDVNPVTDLTEDSFYLNAKDAERALVGCYDGFRTLWTMALPSPQLRRSCRTTVSEAPVKVMEAVTRCSTI